MKKAWLDGFIEDRVVELHSFYREPTGRISWFSAMANVEGANGESGEKIVEGGGDAGGEVEGREIPNVRGWQTSTGPAGRSPAVHRPPWAEITDRTFHLGRLPAYPPSSLPFAEVDPGPASRCPCTSISAPRQTLGV